MAPLIARRSTRVAALLLLGTVAVAPALAQPPPRVVEIRFDHLTSAGDEAHEVDLNGGQKLKVEILQTCKASFTYEIRGIVAAAPPEAVATTSPQLGTEVLEVLHDPQFGGYVVTIHR